MDRRDFIKTAGIGGAALLSGNEAARALPYLRRAARLEPRNTRYLMSLARAFYLLDRPDDSLAVLDRVVAIEPGHADAQALMDKIRSQSVVAE